MGVVAPARLAWHTHRDPGEKEGGERVEGRSESREEVRSEGKRGRGREGKRNKWKSKGGE